MKKRRMFVESVKDVMSCINEVIEGKKIKITDIEREAFLSSGMVSRWKNGKASPTLYNIINVLKYLNISIILEYDSQKKLIPINPLVSLGTPVSLEILEGIIQKKLNCELETDAGKIVNEILFSNKVPMSEKIKLHQQLNNLVVLNNIGIIDEKNN